MGVCVCIYMHTQCFRLRSLDTKRDMLICHPSHMCWFKAHSCVFLYKHTVVHIDTYIHTYPHTYSSLWRHSFKIRYLANTVPRCAMHRHRTDTHIIGSQFALVYSSCTQTGTFVRTQQHWFAVHWHRERPRIYSAHRHRADLQFLHTNKHTCTHAHFSPQQH